MIEIEEDHKKLEFDFLTATGYGPSDILALNWEHRQFYMRNGGLYIFNEDGTITHLGGPDPDPTERL